MRNADKLTTFMGQLSSISGSLILLQPLGPVQACNRRASSLPLPLYYLLLVDKQFQNLTYINTNQIVNKMEFKRFVEEINILPVTGFEPQFSHPVT